MTSLLTARPAAPFDEVKRRIADAVEANRAEILELSHAIHANPEVAFEEHEAAHLVAEAVARHGYAVELPVGRLATAVRGRLSGAGTAGEGQPGRVGVLAEYDALPGLGHGCGHNTMAASGVGAAIALAAVRDAWAGEVVFLGTPAEELGGGKQFMIDDGLFEGLDAALLFHPADRTMVTCELLASEDIEVSFTGEQAHAVEAWKGRNALDALILLFTSIGLWRQQLPVGARVHGVITEGGTAANIIPERTAAQFMVRSPDQAEYERLKERFRQLVEAAALATDTTGEVTFSGGSPTMHDNVPLRDRFRANLQAYGLVDLPIEPERLGSSDMGNVSWVVPTIHPQIAICEDGTAGHSIEFREASISPLADEITLLAATLVAQTAFEVLADPTLREAAWQDFRSG